MKNYCYQWDALSSFSKLFDTSLITNMGLLVYYTILGCNHTYLRGVDVPLQTVVNLWAPIVLVKVCQKGVEVLYR